MSLRCRLPQLSPLHLLCHYCTCCITTAPTVTCMCCAACDAPMPWDADVHWQSPPWSPSLVSSDSDDGGDGDGPTAGSRRMHGAVDTRGPSLPPPPVRCTPREVSVLMTECHASSSPSHTSRCCSCFLSLPCTCSCDRTAASGRAGLAIANQQWCWTGCGDRPGWYASTGTD